MSAKKLPAWKRRRYLRLGIALPEEDRPEPSSPAAEHRTTLADERAIEEAERETEAGYFYGPHDFEREADDVRL